MISKIMSFFEEHGGTIFTVLLIGGFLVLPIIMSILDERGITAEQAEQINVWLYEQPEIEDTIEKYSKDGRINQGEYKRIEDAYKAAIAAEKIPRILR